MSHLYAPHRQQLPRCRHRVGLADGARDQEPMCRCGPPYNAQLIKDRVHPLSPAIHACLSSPNGQTACWSLPGHADPPQSRCCARAMAPLPRPHRQPHERQARARRTRHGTDGQQTFDRRQQGFSDGNAVFGAICVHYDATSKEPRVVGRPWR